MNTLLKIIALIAFYTLVFPPLLVTSFVLLWSSVNPPEYLLGSGFFEFVGGCICGYGGVLAFTKLRGITKAFKVATQPGR